jgi:hypothetical protein
MFGDATYMIQFDDGQEAGISEDAIEAADTAEIGGEDENDEE